MPVYKAGKGRWLIRVFLRGKPTSKIIHGTQKEAAAEEARLRIDLEERAARVDLDRAAVPSFVVFLTEEYAPSAKLRCRPSWFRNQYYILLTLAEFFDGVALDAIGPAEVDAYATKRLEEDDLAATSVNNELRVLRRVFSVAVDRGHLEERPKIEFLPEGERTVTAWTMDELGKLLTATAEESPHLLGIVTFLANTGCRRGEALSLRWENVDLERGLVRIWPSEEWRPKNGKAREIPISDPLLPWLKLPRRSAFVFPTYHGRGKGGRYKTWPSLAFDRARDASGLEGTPHTLRHTFAAHFLAARPDLTLLAEILGHTDQAVTRLYKHLLPDHLARARNAVQVVAPAAAAEALALVRWRMERKPSPVPSPAAKAEPTEMSVPPSGAGYRDRTGDIKLGNMDTPLKILKSLKRDG